MSDQFLDPHSTLNGHWETRAVYDQNGIPHPITDQDDAYSRFHFADGRLTVVRGAITLRAAYRLRPAKTPPALDATRVVGGDQLRFRGIYQMRDGRLALCLAGPERPRPTAFRPGPGVEFALQLQRLADRDAGAAA